jgi:antitoxin VapB
MAKTGIAKLFRNGRSQAVRLPQEFRFEGDRVRIRRIDQGVLLESLIPNAAEWFDELIGSIRTVHGQTSQSTHHPTPRDF